MNRRRIFQPLVTGLLVAVGFGILWGLVVIVASESIGQAIRAKDESKIAVVRFDGTPLILTYQYDPGFKLTYHTLDGKPVEVAAGAQRLTGASLTDGRRVSRVERRWSRRIRSFMDAGTDPAVYWYLIHDGHPDGVAYFDGYDSVAKRPIGYIGLNGFSEELPPPQQWFPIKTRRMGSARFVGQSHSYFEPDYYQAYAVFGKMPNRLATWSVYFVSGGRLLEVDLHERSVRTMLEREGLCCVGQIQWAAAPDATEAEKFAHASRDYLAVRTADQILVLDSEGTPQQSFAIPYGWDDRSFIFYALGDDRAMLTFEHSASLHLDTKHDFAWIDRQGKVTDEKSATFENTSLLNQPRVAMAVGGAAVPAPAIITIAMVVVMPWAAANQGSFPSYWAALDTILPHCRLTLLAVNLLGVVLAILCYRRQKRFAQPRVWPWVVFVFLFGVPGMIGYLVHQRWPVREACPKCKQRAPRDRDACSACDEPFPQPELKGIEVLV